MKKQSKGIVIGATAGLVAGAIAGILLAPKSGKETRADIARYVHEMKDKIAEELTQISDMTQETYNGVVDKVVKVYELGKKITTEDAADIRKRLDDNYDEVVKTMRDTEDKKVA